uniref:CSON011636 protein n=1 Tax=Culicoides sonorensis TaxID=179676 RepID=A0A336KHX1_CULSO
MKLYEALKPEKSLQIWSDFCKQKKNHSKIHELKIIIVSYKNVVMSDILIENYSDNENVYHPIILIKGKITNPVQTCSEISSYISSNAQQKFSLSKKGKFKILHELKSGENKIKFSYNQKLLTELTLNYIDLSNENVRKVQPLYLLCSDTEIEVDELHLNCSKILLGCKLAQSLYAEKLFEGTENRKTFIVTHDCKPFKLQLTETQAHQLSDQSLWELVARNLIKSEIWDCNVKYIAFTAFTKYLGFGDKSPIEYTYAQIRARTLSNPALSTGGLALLGTGCLYTWPTDITQVISHFLDKTRIDIATQLDDSNYRCTYGGCYSTTIGSVCHELGHIFDLGHTKDGIMGKDIDYIGRVFVTDLYTENLPDRIVGIKASIQPEKVKSYHHTFTKIRQPGQYLIKYHEQKDDDLTFFAQNHLITLAFHKWFNFDNKSTCQAQTLKFDRELSTIYSKYQLVLVEIRKCTDGMLIEFWQFTEDDVFEFKFPDNCETNDAVLFVMDIEGNILKQNF